MNLTSFRLDVTSSDDQYLYVEVDNFTIVIKRETEGVVVDVYPFHDLVEPIASTYALHSESLNDDDDSAGSVATAEPSASV